ncbi:MAG: hypothetical protein ABUS79_13335 [Pseudomonadota bacterium]
MTTEKKIDETGAKTAVTIGRTVVKTGTKTGTTTGPIAVRIGTTTDTIVTTTRPRPPQYPYDRCRATRCNLHVAFRSHPSCAAA